MPPETFDPDATLRALAIGQRVLGQRYTLVRVLGRGGMGVVWLARDESLKDDVALKFLPEAVIHDAAAIHDLKHETQRSLKLTHPNIVRIHGFIEDGERAAISMEYVEGATLSKRRLEQPGAVLMPEAVIPVVRQIVEALDYAHNRAKVVHRDLKPANLLISTDGEVKIADFGISATLSDTATRISRREAGSSGSPPYMSPQQMMGEKPCVADDIYALGATIYELLTSKPPFHTGNLVAQVQSKVPPTMQQRRAELIGAAANDMPPIPERWEKTIAACLAKDVPDRPVSVIKLLRGLEDQPPPPARTSSPFEDKKIAPFDEPPTLVVRPEVAATTREPKPLPANTSPKRKSSWLWPIIILAVIALGATAWFTGLIDALPFRPDTLLELQARPGTEVTAKAADGKLFILGIVPAEGKLLASRKLAPGNYELGLRHPDCEPANMPGINLTVGKAALVTGSQTTLPATLNIVTDPPGAEITMQGQSPVTSPASLTRLPSEVPLALEATLRGHRSQATKITLKPSETHTLTLPAFLPDPGTVRLQIKPIEARGPALTAEVDGKAVPIEAGELHDLAPGEHKIAVSHPDYASWQGNATVRTESVTEVEVLLPTKPGTLAINTTPTGASITIKATAPPAADAPALKIAPVVAPAKVSLPAGEYLVRCVLAGHVPAERRIQIAPNKELPLSIPLEVQRGPSTGQTWTIPGLGLAMLPVATGEFDIGPQVNEAGRDPSEGTAMRTTITSPYWLGQNEITRGQWSLVMENRPEPKEPDLPKTDVTYAEVLAFAEHLNARETAANRLPQEHRYTLPTEAQWEYACRAGTKTPFAYGDRIDSTQANFNSAFPYGGAAPSRAVGAPLPVGGFPANAWGFRDMHGNVWEWCLDSSASTPAAGTAVE
ncbi:MAG: hypothetical protein RIQ79_709, partial [Verrucomicrobiota bacterium]